MKILQLNAKPKLAEAASCSLADAITNRLKLKFPGATVMLRDFAKPTRPQLANVAPVPLVTPHMQGAPTQFARFTSDNDLIAEVKSADILVLGLYNFSIPVHLKAWIDAIAGDGKTLAYTGNNPQGLLAGKKAYVAVACGNSCHETVADFQIPYFRGILKFLGITDVEFIHDGGHVIGGKVANSDFAEAKAHMAHTVLSGTQRHFSRAFS